MQETAACELHSGAHRVDKGRPFWMRSVGATERTNRSSLTAFGRFPRRRIPAVQTTTRRQIDAPSPNAAEPAKTCHLPTTVAVAIQRRFVFSDDGRVVMWRRSCAVLRRPRRFWICRGESIESPESRIRPDKTREGFSRLEARCGEEGVSIEPALGLNPESRV
jgi:hypothetical protein